MSQVSQSEAPHGSPGVSTIEELTRIFNTALVATRAESVQDFSTELFTLLESPPFKVILQAIRQLAKNQGTGDKEAAESLIQTFRRIDKIWGDYVFQEGLDRLKNPGRG